MFLLQLFRSDVTRVMLLPAHLWCAPTTLNMITRSKSAARVAVAKRVGKELQASFIGIDSVVLVHFFYRPPVFVFPQVGIVSTGDKQSGSRRRTTARGAVRVHAIPPSPSPTLYLGRSLVSSGCELAMSLSF